MELTETTIRRTDTFNGKLFQVHVDEVRLPNGHTSTREVLEHGPGAAVLPLDDNNNVLTVTQYRYVVHSPLLEIPAGKLEPGEDPAAGALRELKEETGSDPKEFLPLGQILPSPGYCGEIIYLFLARGLRITESHPDEDEFLLTEKIPFEEMVHRCMNGEIKDAKTVVAVLKTKILLGL